MNIVLGNKINLEFKKITKIKKKKFPPLKQSYAIQMREIYFLL